jgi:hypothetical protein
MMRVLDEYLRPRYQPQVIDDAYSAPDTLATLVDHHGPFPCMSGSPGYDGFGMPAMPWFRRVWTSDAAGDDPDLSAVLHNPRFANTAMEVFDAEIVRPSAMVLNLMGPMPTGAAHLDAPTFRGMHRNSLPTWLLSLMGSTGLFHRWAVPVAGALTWVYDRPGDGAYEWWPDGPQGGRESLAGPFDNQALVGDNDYMFHRVGSIGNADKWELAQRFSVKARLEYRDGQACVVDPDDAVKVVYDRSDVRVSMLWRALMFADAEDARRHDEHLDDLEPAIIEQVFRDDLVARGEPVPDSHAILDDPAWLRALNDVYGYTSPDLA